MGAISRFAGNFNALDFAFGISGGAPALQVVSGSTTAGTYTLTCSPATIYNSAGIAVPISTATPVNVGADSGFDSNITLSAVSQNGLNQQLLTGTFTYAHGPGAQVSSATYGLAEAVLASSKYGGGQVTVDAAWFKAGGTQAVINTVNATIPAGVRISNSLQAGISTAVIPLTLAQILAANTTPVTIVPAPGAGYFVDVNDCVFNFIYGSAAYAGGGTVGLNYTNAAGPAATGTVAASVLTSLAANRVEKVLDVAVDQASSAVLNKPVVYTNGTAVFTGGTGGSGLVVCSYKIIGGLS